MPVVLVPLTRKLQPLMLVRTMVADEVEMLVQLIV